MKTRKTLFTLMLAALLVAALAVPVFADIDLPTAPTFVNNDTQKGWGVNGTDMNGVAIETDLTLEQMKNATGLVLEVPEMPVGGLQFVFQCDNGWAWDSTDLTADQLWQDGKLVFNFADMLGWDKIAGSTAQVKFFVAYYDPNFDALGVTKAYLTEAGAAAPADSGGEAAGGNAKTGDSSLLFAAIGALALATGAAVLFVRKVRA
jgi:LPXTG-motif cell wall-anchored protein